MALLWAPCLGEASLGVCLQLQACGVTSIEVLPCSRGRITHAQAWLDLSPGVCHWASSNSSTTSGLSRFSLPKKGAVVHLDRLAPSRRSLLGLQDPLPIDWRLNNQARTVAAIGVLRRQGMEIPLEPCVRCQALEVLDDMGLCALCVAKGDNPFVSIVPPVLRDVGER